MQMLRVVNMQEPEILECAHKIYLQTGIYLPVHNTPEGDKAYKLWAEWMMYRLEGDILEAEAKALAAIEAWEGAILSVIDPWRKYRLLS